MSKILIKRKGYWRKDPKTGRRKWVKPRSFYQKDPGKPGRRARGAKAGPYKDDPKWIKRKGKLGGPGYTKRSRDTRRRLLGRSVKKWGYRSTLGSIMVLLRSTEISGRDRNTLDADKDWLKERYGGPGSFGKPKKRAARRDATKRKAANRRSSKHKLSSSDQRKAMNAYIRKNFGV